MEQHEIDDAIEAEQKRLKEEEKADIAALPKNVRNKKGQKRGEIIRDQRVHKITKNAALWVAESGETPLEYLCKIYRAAVPPDIAELIGEAIVTPDLIVALTDWERVRLEAAKAAAPYVHAKLSNVVHSGDQDNPILLNNEADKFEAAKRIEFAMKLNEEYENDQDISG